MLNLNSLNDAQREAVMHGSGPLLVLAGPGSGKTYTIIQRIFYLLETENVPPENILVITFTKDAALSMQNRFMKMSDQTLPVNFGTFHSVFYHIIKKSHILNSSQILTEAEKKKLIIPIIKKYLTKEELQYRQNDVSEDAITILSAISYYKNTGEMQEAAKRLSEEWQSHFQEILNAYEKERRYQKTIDFDDMVYECYKLLKQNKAVRAYWQKQFCHILMDEFQDINPMQYEVICLLTSEKSNLFAVGDDDQSIYGFRGSKPECLQRFVQEYNAKQICLNINYRSRCEIIQASLAVIHENKKRFAKQLQASPDIEGLISDSEHIVNIHFFEEREQQYQYLITQLRSQEKNKKIGILFRTNAYMQGLAARLSKEGIPYIMKEKVKSIYEHFIVKDIMAYIKVASGKGNRALFLQIMNKPSRYIGRDALGEGIPVYQAIIQYYRSEGLNAYHIKVIQNIEQWEKQMQYLKGLSPYTAVQYIRKVIGYEKYLRGRARGKAEQWQEWEELLNWISLDAANYDDISEWSDAQEAYTRLLAEQDNGGMMKISQNQSAGDESIYLMTVHASKGLEFDKVYIPDCNEKIFPHGTMLDDDACEEERRVFYVAMTRAKENLELLYLTGTKERPRLPSRFLNKLL